MQVADGAAAGKKNVSASAETGDKRSSQFTCLNRRFFAKVVDSTDDSAGHVAISRVKRLEINSYNRPDAIDCNDFPEIPVSDRAR